MATTSTLPVVTRSRQVISRATRSDVLVVTAATTLAFVLLGYHPYAEDGGIYASAAALKLAPSLFPVERGFAIAHTGRSLFIPLVAMLSRALPLPSQIVLLLCYIATLAATMAAGLSLAKQLFHGVRAQRWALFTLSVSMGLPVAGTSLYLADPYLTARSLSTPILLCSLILLLRRKIAAACVLVAVAFVFHPLMAAWAVLLVAAVLARRSAQPMWSLLVLAVLALGAMAAVQGFSPAENAAVHAASLSRDYWFVDQWDWYEVVGMVAPIVLLSVIAFLKQREGLHSNLRDLALAAACAAAIVSVGSILLIHSSDNSFLLARLQPLRLLHSVYLIFALIAGGLIAEVQMRGWRGVSWIVCAAAALGLLFMQRQLYAASGHIEWPFRQPVNGYEQAFLWARDHTPADALFAMDANYTTADGEDAQLFRAVALRSALPDAAKDGGIASVMPGLAPAWQAAVQAQTGLDSATDAQRMARVKPLGATWLLLPEQSKTAFDCPYVNRVAKVCRLP